MRTFRYKLILDRTQDGNLRTFANRESNTLDELLTALYYQRGLFLYHSVPNYHRYTEDLRESHGELRR